MTGTAIGLKKNSVLIVDPGAFVMSGTPVGLFHGYAPLVLSPGTFVMTGEAIALRKNSVLKMDRGAYIVSGSPFELKYSWYRGVSGLSFQFAKRRSKF